MYKVNFKIINVINRLGRRKAKAILFFAQIRDLMSSVAQSCPSLFDPMNGSTPGLLVHHQLPEFTHSDPSSW